MNRIIIAFASICLLVASCGKTNPSTQANPGAAASLSWTYMGTSFNGTSITTSKPDTIPGTHSFWPYYEFQGTASSTTLHPRLTDIAVGSYTDQGNNVIYFGNGALDAFSLSITSRTGKTISGNFTGTYQGQSVTGTFANITFP